MSLMYFQYLEIIIFNLFIIFDERFNFVNLFVLSSLEFFIIQDYQYFHSSFDCLLTFNMKLIKI